ncbi:MAG TPA: hypothetical protein VKT80_19120 [Chloroflexota bacterium]|nr:hypothetical protein [Chloroflexota bacterium]
MMRSVPILLLLDFFVDGLAGVTPAERGRLAPDPADTLFFIRHFPRDCPDRALA